MDDLNYRSYNFYVYPQARDQTFRCSGSCMQFLAEQNFDYNRLFRDGISCCTQETANQLRKQLDEKQRYREDLADGIEAANVDEVPVPAEDLANLDVIRTNIKNVLKSIDKKTVIDKCNAFQLQKISDSVSVMSAMNRAFSSSFLFTKIFSFFISIIIRFVCRKNSLSVTTCFWTSSIWFVNFLSLFRIRWKHSKNLRTKFSPSEFQFHAVSFSTNDSIKNFTFSILDTKHLCSERFREHIPSSVLKHVYGAVLKEPFKLFFYLVQLVRIMSCFVLQSIFVDFKRFCFNLINRGRLIWVRVHRKQPKARSMRLDTIRIWRAYASLDSLELELHVRSDQINYKSQNLRNYLNKLATRLRTH